MRHPRALFLGTLSVILGLIAMIVYGVSPNLFWGSLVAMFFGWLFVEFYRAYVYGRVADRQWQRENPRPPKPERGGHLEGLRVVRGQDQPGKRVMI